MKITERSARSAVGRVLAYALAAALIGSGCVSTLGPGWTAGSSLPAASPLSPTSASAPKASEPSLSGTGDGEAVEDEVVERETSVFECAEVAGFCVTAGESRSLQPVERPGSRTVGRVVLCVYLRYEEGWESSDAPPAPVWNPVEGHLYVLSCRYAEDGNPYVRGYPRQVVYDPGKVPGDAVSGREVAEYAVGLLGLERPRPAIAPPGRQLVGVETWFAVTSRLAYSEASAQAGSTWATVRARFRDVTWDFGSMGELECTTDAATSWDPDLPGDRQTSKCTKVFIHASGPEGLDATVTATWDIDWRSSDNPAWRFLKPFSVTESIHLNIYELQAVIR